jgi:hypothetical protein
MVLFIGMIKEIRKFTSASGDKTFTVKIETNALGNEGVMAKIDDLDQPEVGIGCALMSAEEYAIFEKKLRDKK